MKDEEEEEEQYEAMGILLLRFFKLLRKTRVIILSYILCILCSSS